MRHTLATALMLAVACGLSAQATVKVPASSAVLKEASLKVGDPAPPLKVSRWIKGGPVASLEKGQIYVVEFWATWCGPCKEAMPHLTELARKLMGQVTFVGVSIRETARPGQDLETFIDGWVKAMGAKLDYNLARDTADGFMARQWLDASKTGGIPATFLVDAGGRIVWKGHPNGLDRAIGDLLSSQLGASRAEGQMGGAEAEQTQAAINALKTPLEEAQRAAEAALMAKDYTKLMAIVTTAEAAETDPAKKRRLAVGLHKYRVIALARSDRAGMDALWTEAKGGTSFPSAIAVARTVVKQEGLDSRDYRQALEILEEAFKPTESGKTMVRVPGLRRELALAYWHLGRAKEAVAAMESLLGSEKELRGVSEADLASWRTELKIWQVAAK